MPLDLRERVFEIHKGISASVCLGYIRQGQRRGWSRSNVSDLNPDYSRNRAEIEIDEATLFAVIRGLAPARLDGMDIGALVKERTQCVMYNEREQFGVHTDAPYCAVNGGLTKLTLVLYLNADYVGGETSFPDLPLDVKPEVGKILLFPPDLPHMSKRISHGVKYILRSEVLYWPSSSST